ncbi:CHAD domain-containing protein [Marilutibacter maris]|uniref:CHAD domain-containing protein n=2 Tax=Marilutibacter maris TaxID=1605891 RepID=A0A2U9T0S7_9GAMM|nr:CHAD domain-containing protein [Lysobacter maris]AWV05941.1 hypothetical protein C9I47_0215 [Lysobacter maris]
MTETDDAEPGTATTPPFGPALHRYARGQLDAAGEWLRVDGEPGKRLHKGIHQGRKALRRVRATLALGQPALGPGAELVDRELRRLVRGLGDVRDGQALVETLDRLHADSSGTPIAANLEHARRAVVRRRAALAEATLAADPGLARRRAMLAALAGTLDALPWHALDADTVAEALRASAASVEQARARVAATGRDRHWHRWRRRMRRQSQQYTALQDGGLDPPRGQSAGSAAGVDKDTAVLLGVAQDLSLLLDHCDRGGGFGKADRTALAAFAQAELAKLRERLRACA